MTTMLTLSSANKSFEWLHPAGESAQNHLLGLEEVKHNDMNLKAWLLAELRSSMSLPRASRKTVTPLAK